jgi:ribosomal-protein-alanine N-acetyltransferase
MIEVLEATPAYAQVIAEILAQAGATAWDAATIGALLEKPSVSGLIARADEDRPSGVVLVQRAGDEAEVLNIATLPFARRQGVARELILSVSKQLTMRGVKALHLEVAEDNAPARALYQGLGFEEVGRRKGYYRRAGGALDALLLRLNLVEGGSRTS